jgi:OOP family OmpA-OmpF porin
LAQLCRDELPFVRLYPENRMKKYLLALIGILGLLGCLPSTGVAAELQPWEAGVGLGLIDPGGKRDIDTDFAGLLTLGRRFDQTWGAEVFGMIGNDINLLGARGLYHFDEPYYGWTPYLSAGVGFTDPNPGKVDTTVLIGAGVKRPINENLGLRAELNAHQGLDSGATDFSLFFGVTWSWGASPAPVARSEPPPPPPVVPPPADSDRDGVPDSKDQCPATPSGVKVDASGCPLDSDRDGVPDYKDSCPGTAAGAKVDAEGCPLDSDADGVPDYKDECPSTPAGVSVDANGCPPDSDHDGVPDYKDKCAGTPAGQAVDAAGCPLDSDGDGVPDSRDRCADTPAGTKVNADGCPRLTEKVGITLQLNFDSNSAAIKPEFTDDIDRVASFMRKYPRASVVIEGHTDNTGSSDYNQKLSARRAQAVADSLVRDHGIAADRVRSVGYGDSQPIADNNTSAGRSQNRRVHAAIEETVTR